MKCQFKAHRFIIFLLILIQRTWLSSTYYGLILWNLLITIGVHWNLLQKVYDFSYARNISEFMLKRELREMPMEQVLKTKDKEIDLQSRYGYLVPFNSLEKFYSPLNKVEVKLAIAVLEECVDKFAIMGAKLPDADVSFSMKRLDERARDPFNAIKEEYVVIEDEHDELLLHKLKLSKEVHELIKVLTILKSELKLNESHESLILYNHAMGNIRKEEEYLEKICKGLAGSEGKTVKSLKNSVELTKAELLQLKQEKRELEETAIKVSFEAGISKLYTKRYEENKVEQNRLRISLVERALKQKLHNSLKAIEDENKVHEKIVKYLKKDLKKLQESTEYWEEAYKNDMNDRNIMLIKLGTEISDQRHMMSEMLAEYSRREKSIACYLEEKKERLDKEKAESLLNEAATKIQSWWRGCMVRWKIGACSQELGKRRKKKSTRK